MLELGSPKNVVWTRLASTATANSTTLTLEHDVDWSPGDEIVIATTGDKFSQKETEVSGLPVYFIPQFKNILYC